jgi:uncharacterized membrane protein YgdD (TMEM256/DUF423 family)
VSPSARRVAALASFIALVAVILGAFGAHYLKSRLEPAQLASFETGVRYQMYHAFALLLVALFYDRVPARAMRIAAVLFCVGIVFFSGSIYLLATMHWHWLGPVTPLGGLCLMAGWIAMGVSFLCAKP